MKIKLTPFLLLCIMGGLAIFSSAMSKSPVLPLFIRALDASLGTVGFIAAIVFTSVSLPLPAGNPALAPGAGVHLPRFYHRQLIFGFTMRQIPRSKGATNNDC